MYTIWYGHKNTRKMRAYKKKFDEIETEGGKKEWKQKGRKEKKKKICDLKKSVFFLQPTFFLI